MAAAACGGDGQGGASNRGGSRPALTRCCNGCEMLRYCQGDTNLDVLQCRQDSKIRKSSPCSKWRGSVMYEFPVDLWHSSDAAVTHKTTVHHGTFQSIHFGAAIKVIARHFAEDAYRRTYQWGLKPAEGTWLMFPQNSAVDQATIDRLKLVKHKGPHNLVFLSNKKRFFRVDPGAHEVDPATIERELMPNRPLQAFPPLPGPATFACQELPGLFGGQELPSSPGLMAAASEEGAGGSICESRDDYRVGTLFSVASVGPKEATSLPTISAAAAAPASFPKRKADVPPCLSNTTAVAERDETMSAKRAHRSSLASCESLETRLAQAQAEADALKKENELLRHSKQPEYSAPRLLLGTVSDMLGAFGVQSVMDMFNDKSGSASILSSVQQPDSRRVQHAAEGCSIELAGLNAIMQHGHWKSLIAPRPDFKLEAAQDSLGFTGRWYKMTGVTDLSVKDMTHMVFPSGADCLQWLDGWGFHSFELQASAPDDVTFTVQCSLPCALTYISNFFNMIIRFPEALSIRVVKKHGCPLPGHVTVYMSSKTPHDNVPVFFDSYVISPSPCGNPNKSHYEQTCQAHEHQRFIPAWMIDWMIALQGKSIMDTAVSRFAMAKSSPVQ